jgi:hypothetical protein
VNATLLTEKRDGGKLALFLGRSVVSNHRPFLIGAVGSTQVAFPMGRGMISRPSREGKF